jgi:hypothetical protein
MTRWLVLLDDVELDAVDEGVVVDRAGMSGAHTQRLSIALTRQADVLIGHRGERKNLDRVDLDGDARGLVAAAGPDLRSAPEADRHGDLAGRDGSPKVPAEHHRPNDTAKRL